VALTDPGPGLKAIFENIDNRNDFKTYMQNYAVARNIPKGPRREGLYDEGYVPPLPPMVQAAAQPQQTPQQQMRDVPPPPPPQPATNGNGQAPQQQPPAQQQQQQQQPQDPYAPTMVPAATGATFGVDLGEQLSRDGTEVPKVVIKCAETIEAYGLESMGIYRLSGTTSKVQALKNALDKGGYNTVPSSC